MIYLDMIMLLPTQNALHLNVTSLDLPIYVLLSSATKAELIVA